MSRGWRVLDATAFEGIIRGKPGTLALTRWGEDREFFSVPADEVAVLMIGSKVSLAPSALNRLAKHDIVLLTTDWRGVPISGLYSWSDHGRVAARHRAQASLSLPRKKNAWMQLIRAKVAGQAAVLSSVDDEGGARLKELVPRVRSGDPANVEGTAARLYWARLFRETTSDFRRDATSADNLNAQLNYGYSVLRGYGVRAVLGAGLSPPLGLFHRRRDNFFNLVDDLMEPFRPAIDTLVVANGPDASLTDRNVKQALVAAASAVFTSDGYRVPSVFSDLAQQFGRYVEGDIERLPVPSWPGPQSLPDSAGRGLDESPTHARDDVPQWEPPW